MAGDRAQMHDGTVTFDYMPSKFITFRLEESYRLFRLPVWTGHGGNASGGNMETQRLPVCRQAETQVLATCDSSRMRWGKRTGQAQAIIELPGPGLNNGRWSKSLWWPDCAPTNAGNSGNHGSVLNHLKQ